jgi:hypothetical protein
MKRFTVALGVAVVLSVIPVAVAQHGRGGGSGSHSMGHSTQSHGKPTTDDRQMKAKTVSERLDKNTKLSSKLEKLLPAGTTAQTACAGFKNLGQCVAAVHVSHNLGIPFADLKNKMVGTAATSTSAGTKPMSLGSAIQALAPTADAKQEAKKANAQAKEDLKTPA